MLLFPPLTLAGFLQVRQGIRTTFGSWNIAVKDCANKRNPLRHVRYVRFSARHPTVLTEKTSLTRSGQRPSTWSKVLIPTIHQIILTLFEWAGTSFLCSSTSWARLWTTCQNLLTQRGEIITVEHGVKKPHSPFHMQMIPPQKRNSDLQVMPAHSPDPDTCLIDAFSHLISLYEPRPRSTGGAELPKSGSDAPS